MSIPQRVQSWLVGFALLSALTSAGELGAQQRSGADSVYSRAHRLVAEGRGDAGRALVDSMIRAVAPGSGDYAEALFWRASTSKRAEDAERDYLRIVIEYPLSPRAEEALIRLAEMEMLRGDRTRAQRHLQRLVVEHPGGGSRAKASYWLARIFFEANETTRGCHELNIARSRLALTDVELRNQVDYQAQRCVGLVPAPVIATPAPTSPETAQASKPVSSPPLPARATPESVVSSTRAAQPTPPVPAPSPPPAHSTPPAPTPGASSPASAPTSPAPRERTAATRAFTVQVAAFPEREAALTFMESLKARGYDVRVWGSESPFRIRVGRFATREEASAMAAELRAKMISRDAWVTEMEVR